MQRVGAEEIMLHPLGRGDVAAMVQAIFDSQAPIKDELLDLVVSLTEGIPFFVEEILKALVEAGDIFYADGRWEHKSALSLHILRSAQDAVGQRVEQLSPEGRHVLTLAAVAGQRFDFSLLHELTQLDEGTLLTCIKGLTAAQLLTEASAEQFAFRHALTRQPIPASGSRRRTSASWISSRKQSERPARS